MPSWARQEAVKHRKKQVIVHLSTDIGPVSHLYIIVLLFYFSLLDVIAGRKDPAGLRQGSVLVDGKPVTSDLRLISAYVVQVHKHMQTFFLI